MVLRADSLSYTYADDLARALGHVRISRDGSVYSGPELQLKVQRFEGFFLQPEFDFGRIGAGGRADRIDFIDSSHLRAANAIYTSCPRDGQGDPAWFLSTRSVSLDLDTNEGIADGAVLRFLGVPILAWPTLSFPLNDARKSGWLPPIVDLDTRSGLGLAVPYYWNIAPNRDATIIAVGGHPSRVGARQPSSATSNRASRGAGVELLPYDRLAGTSRQALRFRHEGAFADASGAWQEGRYALQGVRVSDDDWWKDFLATSWRSRARLLPARLEVERRFRLASTQGLVYARVQTWQVQQSVDTITPPYDRSPQIGVRASGPVLGGLEYSFETEFNRFTLRDAVPTDDRPTATRWHALGSVSRPWREPGWWVVPRLSVNSAAYDLDQPCPTANAACRARFRRPAWTPAGRWSATPRPLGASCARHWSRACCTCTRHTESRTRPSRSTRRARTSTSVRSSRRTSSPVSTLSRTRTSSRSA